MLRRAAVTALLLAVVHVELTRAARLSGVTAGQRVRGVLDVSVEDISDSVQSIDLLVNGRKVARCPRRPFRFRWNSAEIWDGVATLSTEARGAAGERLSSAPPLSLTVANGEGTVVYEGPDTAAPWRGLVEVRIRAAHPRGIEAVVFAVDGTVYRVQTGGSGHSLLLDTTALADGSHELFAGVFGDGSPARPTGQIHLQFRTENGEAIQRIQPLWREIVVRPGESVVCPLVLRRANGRVTPLPERVRWVSENPAVCTVDEGGLIQAHGEGYTRILISSGERSAVVRVRSGPAAIAHFSRSGTILRQWEPNKSLFVRTLFGLTGEELDRSPELARAVASASVNVLTGGFYLNPADRAEFSFENWRGAFDAHWARLANWSVKYDMLLLLTGDDMARTAPELRESIAGATGPRAVSYALSKAQESGRVLALEMVDEADFLWGDTPRPRDNRWSSRTPPVPDTAFITLMRLVRAGWSGPVTWPVSGRSAASVAMNWIGDPLLSDYGSHYWTYMDWRHLYPFGASLPQTAAGIERVVEQRSAVLSSGQPFFLLTSLTGPFYRKLGPGGQYVAGRDELQAPPARPEAVAMQVAYAAAAGAAGVRAYHFDTQAWKAERAEADVGKGDLQTGAEPLDAGRDRWDAMSAAFRLIQRLEPWLLAERTSAFDLGPEFITAARVGRFGRLFMAINASERSQTIDPPFREWGSAASRLSWIFRLHGSDLRSYRPEVNSPSSTVIHPAEVIIWVFRNGAR